jgi:hypothetical protein
MLKATSLHSLFSQCMDSKEKIQIAHDLRNNNQLVVFRPRIKLFPSITLEPIRKTPNCSIIGPQIKYLLLK